MTFLVALPLELDSVGRLMVVVEPTFREHGNLLHEFVSVISGFL